VITDDIFQNCVLRAGLAPTVHNSQPARWARDGNVVTLFCDTDVGVPVADPTGASAALSCGAVLEAMILALSAHSLAADVRYTEQDTRAGQGLVPLAHLTLKTGTEDGLHSQLEHRFTWRGAFVSEPVQLFGWTRSDMRLILDQGSKDWIAPLNDRASLSILQNSQFRRELLSWMRLGLGDARTGLDGMDRTALRLNAGQARFLPKAFTRYWRLLNLLGQTKTLASDAAITASTPVIGLFHCDITENPVVSGRAYLRMWLEATSLGFAGWPMAALADHLDINEALCGRFGISQDRRFIQAIRFGKPTGNAPPRARRPLNEVLC